MTRRVAIFISCHPDSKDVARAAWAGALALGKRGADCKIYLVDISAAGVEDAVLAMMGDGDHGSCAIAPAAAFGGAYDIALFFGWRAARYAPVVACERKALVLNDIEAWRHPVGDTYVAAERAILQDLPAISLGRWVGRTLRSAFGLKTFVLPVSTQGLPKAKTLELPRRDSVCAIYEPDAPDMCPHLLIEGLGIFHSNHPKTEIALVGERLPDNLRFPARLISKTSRETRHALFGACSVGVSLNTTAKHDMALQMLAAGLPVVNLFVESNRYDYSNLGVYLAVANSDSVAEAIHVAHCNAVCFDHYALIETFAARTAEAEQDTFADVVERVARGECPPSASEDKISASYFGGAIVSHYFVRARGKTRIEYLLSQE